MGLDITSTDFDFEEDRLREMVSGQSQKLDNQLNVQFYKHAELNSFETAKQGRKIFEEHVYIRILMPANRLNVIERRATDEDRARFRRQFVYFVEKGENLQSGTPLDQLATISAAQVLELKALKVDTIEQLAGIPDTTAQLMGTGGTELKQRAIKFLDRTRNSEELSDEVRALKAKLDEAMAAISKLTPKTDAETVTVATKVVTPAVAK